MKKLIKLKRHTENHPNHYHPRPCYHIYRDWQTVVNESIVRAAVVLYMLDQGFDQKQVLNELANQVCRNFNWMPELVTSLRIHAVYLDNPFVCHNGRKVTKNFRNSCRHR